MKFSKLLIALCVCVTVITSCTKEDDTPNNTTTDDKGGNENPKNTKGSFVLKFDNGVGDQDFAYNTVYSKSDNETYQLETLKYIISNITLKNAEGKTFEYPSDKNIFLINEAAANQAGEIKVELNDVDLADYTEVTFGVGVDQERYKLGADGQGAFLTLAKKEGMLWAWATGYRFMRFDGKYSVKGDADKTDLPLNVHMGSVGTTLDNYRTVTLKLPNSAKVAEGKTPEVHIKADIAKVFDGATSVSFDKGYDQVHTDEKTTPVIADNFKGIFTVDHVHNN